MQKLIALLAACLLVLPLTAQENDAETVEESPVLVRTAAPDPTQIQLTPIASGLNRPLYLTHADDGSGRLFILEQGGIIHIWQDGVILDAPFLDVTNLLTWDVNAGGYTERGLLGLAFHPNYAENGYFFINYTDTDGKTVVARYSVSADNPNSADPNSAAIILTQNQPYPNHNGGHMDFGTDGYLYITLGDGGSADDPLATGQDPSDLLGSILRIDVDNGFPFTNPVTNPFVGNEAGADAVWNYGLRNVWRFSFDRATGDLYMGDVGQNQFEEINFQEASSFGGENYGWRAYEATAPYIGSAVTDVVPPIAQYSHSDGCSITGGYVYRGEAIPNLEGAYLYGDWCTGLVWTAYRNPSMEWQSSVFLRTGYRISSFGEDEAGELYILDYSGDIYRIDPA